MFLTSTTPKKALNKTFFKQNLKRSEINILKEGLTKLSGRFNDSESEEHLKNIISDFLKETWYNGRFEINTKERIDLAIHNGKTSRDPVGVIVEVKKPSSPERITAGNLNCKALHELILYYFEERIEKKNIQVKHLVATNIYEWFIFDENEFDKLFYRNTALQKLYKVKTEQCKDNPFFYSEAQKIVAALEDEITCTLLDLRKYLPGSTKNSDFKDDHLIELHKILSPEHLLKLPFQNDSNSLNKEFYNELLHIIGLEEVKEGSKKLISRKRPETRDAGSLLENTVNLLRVEGCLENLKDAGQYGSSEDEQLFSVALELCINWLNRILFLKLLEGQLISYHRGNKEFSFLNSKTIRDFDELNELFFEVLAVKNNERTEPVSKKFSNIPYLNSSLFERTSLENQTIRINSLKDRLELPVYRSTVLKDAFGNRISGSKSTLHYLFDFLDAFDFASESTAAIQEQNKTLINASVLGLIFEKINGYKEGSFFTPGFITMYMCHETIRRATVQKFNDQYGWNLVEFSELRDKINCADKTERRKANAIINSLKICDPAVGSGHFLVSALNEMIALKSELGILEYRDGSRIRGYRISIENDELIITDEETETNFSYKLNQNNHPILELQNLQEAIFHEKQTIIENCLFGVDINPKSVMICRLRLWIELLKNAYYIFNPPAGNDSHAQPILQTLPNIDINIKCGNSLISRFPLDADLKQALKKSKWNIDSYRVAVQTYRNASSKAEKREMEKLIDSIKNDFESEISRNDKRFLRLVKLKGELTRLTTQTTLFEKTKKEMDDWNKQVNAVTSDIQKLEAELEEIKNNVIYRNAFEWRFEFPEVLDENGDFVGFDVVIGNPPYIRQEELSNIKPYLQFNYNTFAGTADLYVFFVEKGLSILQNRGEFIFILPNKWMRAGYGIKLRTWIKQFSINSIVDFGDLPVFEEATTYPCLWSIKKDKPAFDQFTVSIIDTLSFQKGLANYIEEKRFKVNHIQLNENGWTLVNDNVQNLIQKIKSAGKPLGEYVNGKIFRGVLTGLNEAFVIDSATRDRLIAEDPKSSEIIKPFLAGRDIKRYQQTSPENYLILFKSGQTRSMFGNLSELDAWEQLKKAYPSVSRYLSNFENKARARYDKGQYWWELRACDYYEEFEKSKIIIPAISQNANCMYDKNNYYSNDKTTIIPSDDLFLLAILNSKLIDFFLKSIASTKQNGYYEYKPVYISQLPIANIKNKNIFNELVDQIISLKIINCISNIKELENKIDQMVYNLYGINKEEIGIIESEVIRNS